ncbi:unnamed protein product [Brassica rapa]|uniref:Uncharacterized protein n=1 Tax=Brassica campestris TaxID=3711 RepID=A0A8D9HJ37_BRACM|nr:unnamed protein product [Brassica rapa]
MEKGVFGLKSGGRSVGSPMLQLIAIIYGEHANFCRFRYDLVHFGDSRDIWIMKRTEAEKLKSESICHYGVDQHSVWYRSAPVSS